ncbi:MAG: biotin--[acetyl-CoA-carboxylase] ligase [Methanobacteriaceae archaeon]|nr:biotin--[acetyl-CoA-carboxylase] ligase [Methanobacteriaceae archaeon]
MNNNIIQLLLDEIDEELVYKSDKINSKSIKEYLKTNNVENSKIIEKPIYCFSKVTSTNTIAKFLAENNAEDGTVVIAETQTKARGRSAKKWESPKGGIWLSIILKPQINLSKSPIITLFTGVAVAKTLKSFGVDAKIKWPNDVLINGKKISGILTESNTTSSDINYIIVGVGIDTNLKIDDFKDKELKNRITTLNEELGKNIDENEFIAKFLIEFEEIYNLYKKEDFENTLNDWRTLSDTIGKNVKIIQTNEEKYGYAIDINNNGNLIIKKENGELEKITYGECRTVD